MPRQVNAATLALIRFNEDCKLCAYPDPGSGGDPWTIGWGATGRGICKGVVWTQAQADARLQQDIATLVDEIDNATGAVPTTDNQFGAMTSLAYNIGIGHFLGSSVLRLHKAGAHREAAAAFAMWDRAHGHVVPGLTTRRAAEAALYLRPDVTGSQPRDGSDGDDRA